MSPAAGASALLQSPFMTLTPRPLSAPTHRHRLSFFVLAGLALLIGLSVTQAASSTSSPPIVQSTTSQGARLVFLQAPAIPIVDLGIDIDAGSRWDSAGKEGLAGMVAGMVFRGLRATTTQPALSEADLGRVWADLALERSGGASQDRTSLRFRFLSESQVRESAGHWIGRVLADAALQGEILAREQSRAIAGLKDSLKRPQSIATRALWQAMYPGHPYGRAESVESLSSLTTTDLEQFHQSFWRPDRITLTIVGDLSPQDAQALAEKLLAPLAGLQKQRPEPAAGQTPTSAMPSVLPPVRIAGEGKTMSIDHSATQSHIWIGMPMLARHERNEFFTLMVANHILGGGGFTSRLTQEIREKRGLSYSVFSAVSPLAQPGPFLVGLQTQREKSDEALEVVRATLAAFVNDGPTDEEMEAAKKNLLGGFALRLDSNRKLLETLAQMGFYRLPLNYLDTWTEAVSLVTKEDVKVILKQRLVLSRLSTVVVAGQSSAGGQ